jgi:hypothetical protein
LTSGESLLVPGSAGITGAGGSVGGALRSLSMTDFATSEAERK